MRRSSSGSASPERPRRCSTAMPRGSSRRSWSRGSRRRCSGSAVTIYEGTSVSELVPGAARTDRGTVRARYVLSCLEGFTAGLRGQRRTWLPLNSAIVVTAPLPADALERDRLGGRRAARRLGARIRVRAANGGRPDRARRPRRAVPLRLAARTMTGRRRTRTIHQLTATLAEMFPAARLGADRSGLVRRARRGARLVADGPPRSGDRAWDRRRLRRERRRHHEPRRPDAARPGPRQANRADRAPLGRAHRAPLGARAVRAGSEPGSCTGCTGTRTAARPRPAPSATNPAARFADLLSGR